MLYPFLSFPLPTAMTLRTLLTVLVLVLVSKPSLTAIADDPTSEQLQYFEQKVRPLLVANCFECHSSESKKTEWRSIAR